MTVRGASVGGPSRAWWRSRARRLGVMSGRAAPLWEALESRHMLAVDLTGAFTLAPINVRPGDTLIDVPYSVTNLGDEASANVPLRFVLSSSGNASDPNNVVLRDFAISPVPAGQNNAGVASLLIPADTVAGSYTIFMLVDPDNQISETNENNNTSSSPANAVTVAGTPVFADLSAAISVTGGSFLPTQELHISLTSRNLGQAAAIDFITRIVLSRNTIFGDGDDIALEDLQDGLLPGDNFTDAGTVFIPEVIAPGAYYVIVKIDAANQIDETDENNNEARTAFASVTIAPPPVVSIIASRPTTSETAGLGGQYTLIRTGSPTLGLTVNLLIGGTATSGDDYVPLLAIATFLPGSSVATIDVTPIDDLLVESSETVIVSLTVGDGYTVSTTQATATVTITDNEPTISLVSTRNAGESPASTGLFTFTRTGGTNTGPLTVFYSLQLGTTASSGVDFEPLSGMVTFAAGSATATVVVTSIQDQLVEVTESVVIAISAHESYRISTTQNAATVTIADDEPTITLAVTDSVANESAGNTATFTFTRSSGDTTSELTVFYTYVNGLTALAGVDYLALSGSVTFAAGATTATVTVVPIDDALVEPTETMGIMLLGNLAYRLGTATSAQATILDNEPTVTLTSTDTVLSETAGDTAIFTFTRSNGDISGPLTVLYAIQPGATMSGPDYLATPGLSGQITFAAGAATATITISGVDDSIVEATETLTLALVSQNSYRLGAQTSVTISILDNEPTVTLVASDASGNETPGDGATFTFTRGAGDISGPLTVLYSISGASTANGADFMASPTLSGSITFAAGSATATITISVIDDTFVEDDETIVLTLIAQNSYRLGSQTTATVTIHDNEPTVTITASDPTASETPGDTGTFTFTRSGGPITAPLGILYTISGASTATGIDFGATPALTGIVTIPAGQTSVTITINPSDDTTPETDEMVILIITPQNNYRVGGSGTATVTIIDNEPRVSVTASNGAEGGTPVVFTLSRTGPTTGALVTTFTLTGDAVMGTDYANIALTAMFAAGQSTTTVTLNITDDALVEPGESVILTLVAGATYSVSPTAGSATAMIVDNEPTISVVASTPTGSEQPGGGGLIRFTFSRAEGSTSSALTVNFTLGGTGTSGVDYAGIPLSATFAAGASTTVVTINILDDVLAEATETVMLSLTASTSYRVSATNGSATGSIIDDEPVVSVAASTGNVGEGDGNPVVFTLSRTGPTGGSLIVSFTLGGTASVGSDYQAVPLMATFSAGSSTATVSIMVNDDAVAEAGETIILTLSDGAAYHASPTQGSATATIVDNEPTVSVVVISATSAEGGFGAANQLIFRLSREGGSTASTLNVAFTLTGSAIMGEDFSTIPLMATFAAGDATTTVTLNVIDDALAEDLEAAILTISPNAAYRVNPAQASASGTIADNEPIVSVLNFVPLATEGIASPIRFLLQRTGGSISGPLTVSFTFSGAAAMGDDFQTMTLTATFAANSAVAFVVVNVLDDQLPESPESLILNIAPGAAYRVSDVRASATATINDNEPVVAVIPLTPRLPEGGFTPARFMLQRLGGSLAQPLTVNFTLGGTATSGDDYEAITLSATFAANTAVVFVTIPTIDDTAVEPNETLILTVVAGPGYTPDATRGSGTAIITDNEPEISVIAVDPAAGEASLGGRPNTGRVMFLRTGPFTQALTVNYVLLGTATSDLDFMALDGTITFAAGSPTAFLDITPVDDVIAEAPETVIVQVGWGATYRLSSFRSSATVTITDDEPVVSIVAIAPAASETNALTSRFLISRTGSMTGPLTISYTLGGTATSGDDYLSPTGLIEIPAGQRSVTLTITPIDDLLAEDSETIIVSLVPTESYALSTFQPSATARIADNEPLVSIIAVDPIAGEANNPGRYLIRRTGPTTGPLTVSYTVGGTAQAGSDYQPLSGTIIIPAGALTADLDLAVLQDSLGEGDETVIVTLSESAGYRIQARLDVAQVRITDDEPVILLFPLTPVISEGSATPMRFMLRRIGDLSQAITVFYDLGNGTAQPNLDFVAPSGSVTFAPGAAIANLEITLTDDGVGELSETLSVELVSGDGYRLGTTLTTASATITDNEPTISVFASIPFITEGGTLAGRFTLQRSGSTAQELMVAYTLEGTATEGDDFEMVSGVAVFAAGQLTTTVTITTLSDTAGEPRETVILRASEGAGYRVITPFFPPTVTINDDEPQVTVFVLDPRAGEGTTDRGSVMFRRTSSTSPLTIAYTVSGTASSTDFEPLSGSIMFEAGQLTTTLSITALVDALAESDETVIISIMGGEGYAPGLQSSATVTIAANGPEVSVRAIDPVAGETRPGALQNPGRFMFTRTGDVTQPLTVFFHLEGDATSGADFVNPGASITFGAGERTVMLDLDVIDDDEGEPGEFVQLVLDASDAYRLSSFFASSRVNITDDEARVILTPLDTFSSETGAGTDTARFIITRLGAFTDDLIVNYTLGGTATNGDDYEMLNGSILIPAGQRTAIITVAPIGDNTDEPQETVTIALAGGPGYALGFITSSAAVINNLVASDLRLTSLTFLPASYSASTPGQSLSIELEFENAGLLSAAVYFIEIRLSSDTILGNDDDLVLSAIAQPGLAAGGSGTLMLTLLLDSAGTPPSPGGYYVGARIDSARRVIESNESNNDFVSPAPSITIVA